MACYITATSTIYGCQLFRFDGVRLLWALALVELVTTATFLLLSNFFAAIDCYCRLQGKQTTHFSYVWRICVRVCVCIAPSQLHRQALFSSFNLHILLRHITTEITFPSLSLFQVQCFCHYANSPPFLAGEIALQYTRRTNSYPTTSCSSFALAVRLFSCVCIRRRESYFFCFIWIKFIVSAINKEQIPAHLNIVAGLSRRKRSSVCGKQMRQNLRMICNQLCACACACVSPFPYHFN